MTEITATEHAAQLGRITRVNLTYGYYRQPNGWITVSPINDLDELKYRREGWEALTEYGKVEMASEYAADHPLEGLFMAGGAKELCVEQIIESALHLNPPLIPSCRRTLDQFHKRHTAVCWRGAEKVAFPQLGDGERLSFQCHFCDRPPFATEAKRSQHESVMHKEEKSDIRQGEALASALAKGLRGEQDSPGLATINVEVKSDNPEVKERKPYACGQCPESFTSPVQLIRHVKDVHKKGKEADG